MPEKIPYVEFVKKTSMFRDRVQTPGSTWQAVLSAYQSYASPAPPPKAAEHLYEALHNYYAKHGQSDWKKVDRDKESKGLLQRLHAQLGTEVQLTTRDDILNSRYGVLYVLSNVDIEAEFSPGAFAGELVANIGSVVGTSVGTQYGNVGNADASKIAVKIGPLDTSANDLTGHGAMAAQMIGKGIDAARAPSTRPPVPFTFPATSAALEWAGQSLSENFGPNVMADGMAKAGIVLATGVALIATTAYDLLRTLWEKVKPIIKAGFDKIVATQRENNPFNYERLASVLGSLTKVILNFVAKEAVPFVSAGVDCAVGAAKAVEAVIDKIRLKLERGRFTLMPGHPELMAKYIEDTTLTRMGKGLLDAASGAASIVTQVFAPGLGSLIAAITKAVAWGCGWIIKYMEHCRLKQFLGEARALYKKERERAEAAEWAARMKHVAVAARAASQPMTDALPTTRARSNAVTYRADFPQPAPAQSTYVPPDPRSPLLSDVAEFTKFFLRGCQASPLVPMVVLRSHICGSLISFAKLTGWNGDLVSNAQYQFDAAERYFAHLKRLSLTYIEKSGFNVRVVPGASDQAQAMIKLVLNQFPPFQVAPLQAAAVGAPVAVVAATGPVPIAVAP